MSPWTDTDVRELLSKITLTEFVIGSGDDRLRMEYCARVARCNWDARGGRKRRGFVGLLQVNLDYFPVDRCSMGIYLAADVADESSRRSKGKVAPGSPVERAARPSFTRLISRLRPWAFLIYPCCAFTRSPQAKGIFIYAPSAPFRFDTFPCCT